MSHLKIDFTLTTEFEDMLPKGPTANDYPGNLYGAESDSFGCRGMFILKRFAKEPFLARLVSAKSEHSKKTDAVDLMRIQRAPFLRETMARVVELSAREKPDAAETRLYPRDKMSVLPRIDGDGYANALILSFDGRDDDGSAIVTIHIFNWFLVELVMQVSMADQYAIIRIDGSGKAESLNFRSFVPFVSRSVPVGAVAPLILPKEQYAPLTDMVLPLIREYGFRARWSSTAFDDGHKPGTIRPFIGEPGGPTGGSNDGVE